MTPPEFAQLVTRLEEAAVRAPGRYRWRVLGLAFLGNAYFGALLLGSVALIAVAVTARSGYGAVLGFCLIAWMLLRAMWIKVEPPDGIKLSASQAPQLFAMVDRLRSALGAPRLDHVLITDAFNAAVVQVPRLGVFGWTAQLPAARPAADESVDRAAVRSRACTRAGALVSRAWPHGQLDLSPATALEPAARRARGHRFAVRVPLLRQCAGHALSQLVCSALQRLLISSCPGGRIRCRRDLGSADFESGDRRGTDQHRGLQPLFEPALLASHL